MPEFDEHGNEIEEQPDNSVIKQMRSTIDTVKAENESLTVEAEEGRAAKRELAFINAGIDTSQGIGKFFAKSYDGELTADAVKAAAIEEGVIEIKPDTPPAEQQEHERIHSATMGAEPALGEPPADPNPSMTAFNKVMKETDGNRKQAMGSAFRAKADAAAKEGAPGIVTR